MKRRLLLVLICVMQACVTPALAVEGETSSRIANIERGLRPAQALLGTPLPVTRLEEEMRRLHVPGLSIAVIDQGKLAWSKGYGVITPGGPPITPETLFQAASISKPITAFGAMTMVQSAKLDLNRSAQTYLRQWALPEGGEQITVLQLLSHTSGLGVSGFPGYAADQPVPTLLQVLDGKRPAYTKAVRVEAIPGTVWKYSGGGYSVLQQLMTEVADQSFESYMRENVLQPLGMKASHFHHPVEAEVRRQTALPHDSTGRPYPGGPSIYPELAAAGMWTTPSELAMFALGVQAAVAGNSSVLDRAQARKMLTPVKNGYALGFETSGSGSGASFAHGGSNRGYQNYLYAFEAGGRGAVVMSNGDAGDEVARATMRAIAAEYDWPGYQTSMRRSLPLSAGMARKLAGKYAIAGLGDFEITVRNGSAIFWIKAGQGERLYRESATRFFVLSNALELRFDRAAGGAGRIIAGPFNEPFTRVEQQAAK